MTIDARSFFTGNPTPVPTSTKKTAWAYVDEQGRLVLPPEVAAQSGLVPGAQDAAGTDAQRPAPAPVRDPSG